MLTQIQQELLSKANPDKVKILRSFFKTGKGDYGEGDKFLGLTVPTQRIIAKKYYSKLALNEAEQLLHNQYHEFRLTALIILTYKFAQADEQQKTEIFQTYLNNTKYINNWDLVDVTTPQIIGGYLLDKDRSILYKLAKSSHLWERRISILATLAFIRSNQFQDTLKIAELLLNDQHDLIHKAVGWMLREVGKRNQAVEEQFLHKHYKTMPRTMLRYAIEKFDEQKKQKYMGR